MVRVGRNDPCPCGSGRKYKNCCMRQARFAESRELNLDSAEGTLLNVIYQYAQSARFLSDTVDAFHFFWGGVFDLDGIAQLDYEDRLRTVEWFIHDYKTKADGRHLIDLFIENEATDFRPEALRVLEAWARSVMGLFRVLAVGPGTSLRLYDPLRQRELTVQDPMLARNALQGDLLVGRHLVLDGVNRLSLMTMILPKEHEPGLVGYVTNAYGLYREEHPKADWDVFLRENGHLFQAYMLSSRAEALRSLIGPGTRYHDPALARDKLAAHTRERMRREQEEAMEPEDREPLFHRTAAGIILPGAEREREPAPSPREPAPEPSRPHILIPGRDF
ncbi:MAG: SEC-C domain-containing protein [Chloroflexi bacterium]|nr:SEC-C domain-containing protein [Chloroflexota bacterium]